jgi:asparagine synthase (glutamine-hydrolysing)
MCGIAGITGDSPPESIASMVAAMHHRGPDDSGIYRDAGIALGMARLAVIDITPTGHQPMGNHDGMVWIVYNGETYNFRQERVILEGKGHRFVSQSDTEVVLCMYEEYGDDVCPGYL